MKKVKWVFVICLMILASFSFAKSPSSYKNKECEKNKDASSTNLFKTNSALQTTLDVAVIADAKFNPDVLTSVCYFICSDDQTNFELNFKKLISVLPGKDDKEKRQEFAKNYYDKTLCPTKMVNSFAGNNLCAHINENFLRTAYMDRATTVARRMLDWGYYDLLKKDPMDNKNTVEWVQEMCVTEEDQVSKDYFCGIKGTLENRVCLSRPEPKPAYCP